MTSPLEFPASDLPPSLFCLSFNDRSLQTQPEPKSSILILHGALDSTKTWHSVGTALSPYHVLIPALPLHHESRFIGPLTITHTADLLSELVRARAIGQRVHLVGFSYSVRIALDFASRYSDLVTDVVVCGYGRFPFPDSIAAPMYRLSSALEGCIPNSVVKWLMHGQEFDTSHSMSLDGELARAITSIQNAPLDSIPALRQRCLVVAGTQGGILPSDSVKLTENLVKRLQEGNKYSLAAQYTQVKHPWPVQQPSRFAEMVQLWIEDGALPTWLEALTS